MIKNGDQGRVRQAGITGPDGQPLQRLEKPPEG
jgi:hypothetical protein